VVLVVSMSSTHSALNGDGTGRDRTGQGVTGVARKGV
jgi:hypothetical protein